MSDDAQILDSIDRWLKTKVAPVASRFEEADEYPAELVADMQELGLFGALMAYGGWQWATAKWGEKKPMLPVPDGIDYVPLVIAGVLIVAFSIEHVIALVQGKVVEPAWN